MILKKPAFKRIRGISIVGVADKRFDIEIKHGRFVSVTETDQGAEAIASAPSDSFSTNASEWEKAETIDGSGLWISPGLIDLHTHMAWTDFDHADQDKRDPAEVEAMQAQAFEATLRTGVTTVRDAGGLAPSVASHLVRTYGHPLRIDNGSHMFGAADSLGIEHLKRKADEVFASGANWIKIMATGGLGAPTDKVTDPVFSEEEFAFLVRYAHENDRKVFVHAWGGAAIDWSAQAGVQSIEHGMFLTSDQAGRLAEANVAFVPTASIYRIAADPQGVLALPPVIRERAARAVEAHANAVAHAQKAGVRIGFGTDYATPHLHGRNLQELYTLLDYGMTHQAIWTSATSEAAHILERSDELGSIKEGYLADAVVFASDPYLAQNETQLRQSIKVVLIGNDEEELSTHSK